MQQGKVKWFNPTKGFGFILSEGKEYFVHKRQVLRGDLVEGMSVKFDAVCQPKGESAINVEPFNDIMNGNSW